MDRTWRILFAKPGDTVCLQSLALRCGYRIGEICGLLGCSERYFQKVFLEDVGLAPKDWMRRERMVVARRMLTGGRTAGEVALSLGFASEGTFRREFQSCHQVSPARYQRETWGG